MVVELAAHAYEGVLPLSADLTCHLSISAVLRGAMPGHVLVDSERFPGTVLVSSPEGNYLASVEPVGVAERSAGRALVEQLAGDEPSIELYVTPAWEQHAASSSLVSTVPGSHAGTTPSPPLRAPGISISRRR